VLSDSADTHIQVLLPQLNVFTPAYYRCLGTYVLEGTMPSESAVVDVEHAFIALKLWLLLAQMPLANLTRESYSVKAIWNELWPPFEALVNLFQADNVPEDLLVRYLTLTQEFCIDAVPSATGHDNMGFRSKLISLRAPITLTCRVGHRTACGNAESLA
jgi:hypothetical protein